MVDKIHFCIMIKFSNFTWRLIKDINVNASNEYYVGSNFSFRTNTHSHTHTHTHLHTHYRACVSKVNYFFLYFMILISLISSKKIKKAHERSNKTIWLLKLYFWKIFWYTKIFFPELKTQEKNRKHIMIYIMYIIGSESIIILKKSFDN